ncbi:Antibiotic biosynthesis monooxygenase [Desulfarculales bacterium]
MSTDDYTVTVELLASPGQEGALPQVCRELAPLCRALPGCQVRLPLHDHEEPRRFLVFMRLRDEAAYQEMLSSPLLQDFRERLAPWLLEGPPRTKAFNKVLV